MGSDYADQVATCETGVANCEAEKAASAQQVATCETEKSNVAGQVATCETEKATLEAEKTASAQQAANCEAAKSDLAVQVATLETEKTACVDSAARSEATKTDCDDSAKSTWQAIGIIFIALTIVACLGMVFFFLKWNMEVAFKFQQMSDYVDQANSPHTSGGSKFT